MQYRHYGGVETYQRRYLYMAAFDIIESDWFDAKSGKDDLIKKEIEEALRKAITDNKVPTEKVTSALTALGHTRINQLKNEEVANFTEAIGVN